MSVLRDLQSARVIYFKAVMFLTIAGLSAAILLSRLPSWENLFLLTICVWASCRAYYFAFYVIEKYVDPTFRFSGLFDFARYLMGRQKP